MERDNNMQLNIIQRGVKQLLGSYFWAILFKN